MNSALRAGLVAGLALWCMGGLAGPLGSMGTYNGTLTYKIYDVVTGEKTIGKEAVVLTINTNATYSMHINNFYTYIGTATIGETVAALHFQDSFEEMHTNLHFKLPIAKGTFLNTTIVSGSKSVWDGKLTLKKQP